MVEIDFFEICPCSGKGNVTGNNIKGNMFSKKKSYSLRKLRHSNRDTTNATSDEDNNDTVSKQVGSEKLRYFLGCFCILLYAIFSQSMSVVIKILPYIDPCQLSLIRSLGLIAAILPVAIYHTETILGKKKYRRQLVARGIFGSTAIYMSVIAYRYLPLAEASIVMSTVPITTAAMARIWLKEPFGLIQSLSLFITVCGVLAALKIPVMLRNRKSVHFDVTYIFGLVASFAFVLLITLNSLYVRKLKEIHFSVHVFYLGFFGAIEAAVIIGFFIPFALPDCGWEQFYILLYGIFGILVSILYTLAFKILPAGLCSALASSFEILVVLVYDIIFFNIYPDTYIICGACLVIMSLSILGIRSWI